MLLTNLRQILAQMREDEAIASELPIVIASIKRTFVWMIFTELFLVLQVFPVKFFIDEISAPEGPSTKNIILIALSFVVLYKLGQEFRRRMDIHRNAVYWGCWRIWWGYGMRCLLRQSSDFHTAHSTGEKDSLVGKNVTKFQSLFDEALFNTIPVTLRVFFTTVLMYFIGWHYGIIATATCIIYALTLWYSEHRVTPLRKAFLAQMKAVEDHGSELNQNWRTIRMLGMEEDFADDNDHFLRNFWHDEKPRHRLFLRYILLQDDVVTISRAVLYLVSGILVIQTNSLSLGSIVLATTWMERAYSNFGRLSDFQRMLNTGKEALKELAMFMQTPPTIQSADVPQWPAVATGKISFDNVTFAYKDTSEEPTICRLSFEIPAYSSTAIVGESGCGKSTLMRLVTREYDPIHGRISIDDVSLTAIEYTRYRREMIAVVSQTIELFNRSIAKNISIGRPEATMDEVIAAAIAAGAHEFITALEDGYNTEIGENGLRLSGGQRQRLAIARALIMRPTILILDEATSALDAMSQAEVQATIENLIAERVCTIFIIAHRLSTIRKADRIIVLRSGKIEESGTHDELMESSPTYQDMVRLELAS